MSAIKGQFVSADSAHLDPAIKDELFEPAEPGPAVGDGLLVPGESGKTVPDKPAHLVNPGALDPIEQSDVSENELVISIL
jgi:hypothetical protein